MISKIPSATFHTRQYVEESELENPYDWKIQTSVDLFSGKSVVLLAVPAAFSPTCSDEHLPEFEQDYSEFMALGIDEIYCLSVNDAFVMFQWAEALNIKNVKMLPDGNAEFTRKMGMLVELTDEGMGLRSWRYSMYVENGEISKILAEPGIEDNAPDAPISLSKSQTMLEHLKLRILG